MRQSLQNGGTSKSRWSRDHHLGAEAPLPATIEHLQTILFPRAQRFPIKTAIRYREQGSSRWYEGNTLNISQSGVLFGTRQAPAPNTAVEMMFLLPLESRQNCGGQVICQGVVVRTAHAGGLPQVAATIVRYRLVRRIEGTRHKV